MEKTSNSRSYRLKRRSLYIIITYLILMGLAAWMFHKYGDREHLQAIIERAGHFGVVVYALLQIIYVALTPLLNTAILILSGYLFGGHLGFLINFFATSLGLFLIVFLVKRYGRPMLQKVVSRRFYHRFDALTEKIGPLTLLIMYVIPFTPDDELTYIVAAGPIGFKRFILPILLGTIAKSTYSYIGDLGAEGISIAATARVSMLIIGLLVVGAQEYMVKKR